MGNGFSQEDVDRMNDRQDQRHERERQEQQKRFDSFLRLAQEQRRLLEEEKRELQEQIKKEKQRTQEAFDNCVKKAVGVLQNLKNSSATRVVVVLGQQGAGKSTLVRYMFEVNEGTPVEGDSHGTRELTMGFSTVLDINIVDTIGKLPSIKGMMRVIACVYNKGWDPEAVVVVQLGRVARYELVASYMQMSKINVIDFAPSQFYKCLENNFETDMALKWAICDKVPQFPHVHKISMPKDPDSSIRFEPCYLTANLLPALEVLDYNTYNEASEEDGIGLSLSYYMAKCIANRADFTGSDFDFIEREE